MSIGPRPIHDITAQNRSEVPASRGSNPINWIVIHYLGVANADNPNLYGGGYGGHYNITRDGTIYKAADPRTAVVWQCGGGIQGEGPGAHRYYGQCTNYNSIGIENGVCYDSDWYFTTETQESLVYLVSTLMDEYGIDISHVIRHYDVTGKRCLPTDITEVLTPDGWKKLAEIGTGETIACYDSETDHIIWDAVTNVVEPYVSEVLMNRSVEATADHRMWLKPNSVNSHKYKEVTWGSVLEGHKQYLIKNGAEYDAQGLPLTDDELRLLVWIQGDGCYTKRKNHQKEYCGLEFHLSKERKKVRIKSLLESLGIEYLVHKCLNGTEHVRISNKEIVEWSEEWLEEKQFSYKLLEMTKRQWEIVLEELMVVDGCVSAQVYTSKQRQNLDVVQALAALHGNRTHIVSMGSTGKNNLAFATSNYSVGNGRGSSGTTKRTTEVSCVSVPTGYILVRQNEKTFIVGNCPAPYVANNKHNTSWTWDEFITKLANYRNGTPQEDDDKVIKDIFKKARIKKMYAKPKYRTVKQCDFLNVRMAPDQSAPIHPYWGKLMTGNGVQEICKFDNGWSCVYIGAGAGTGTIGYMASSYLK